MESRTELRSSSFFFAGGRRGLGLLRFFGFGLLGGVFASSRLTVSSSGGGGAGGRRCDRPRLPRRLLLLQVLASSVTGAMSVTSPIVISSSGITIIGVALSLACDLFPPCDMTPATTAPT